MQRFDPQSLGSFIGNAKVAPGFPRVHEIFAGNRSDSTTVGDMLAVLQKQLAKTKDATVVVDRGMAKPGNLATIRQAGYSLVGAGGCSRSGSAKILTSMKSRPAGGRSLLTLALGIAFRSQGPQTSQVGVEAGPQAVSIAASLSACPNLAVVTPAPVSGLWVAGQQFSSSSGSRLSFSFIDILRLLPDSGA